MKKILCVLMSCMLLVITGCSGHSKNLKFGAADIGGMYYSFASTFTQLADKEIDGYTFETRTTAGSVANLRLISDGYIDLAIVQADLLSAAIMQQEPSLIRSIRRVIRQLRLFIQKPVRLL